MAYPSFNLATIQLPAPTSSMTKAEYKTAFGIDLDAVNIKSIKLVIFGNDKYAIDQIKEVEGGIEIYFNGRILSITDIVQTSDEVYDVANAKPLFWHGVEVGTSNGDKLQLNMVFITNDDSEINSVDKLITKIVSFGVDAFINIDGFYNENSENMCNATSFYVAGANQIYLIGNASDCTRVAIAKTPAEWKTLLSGVTGIHVTDRINKLN